MIKSSIFLTNRPSIIILKRQKESYYKYLILTYLALNLKEEKD
jgi:hypothetical protein